MRSVRGGIIFDAPIRQTAMKGTDKRGGLWSWRGDREVG